MPEHHCEGIVMGNSYRAHEFARLAGVTVRALHHYDRVGLLRPERSRSGYRLYRDSDLERLERIAALKFIGVPLKKIKTLFELAEPELSHALRMQRRVLEEKKRHIEAAIDAIRAAEAELMPGRRLEPRVLRRIIEVMNMQSDNDWIMKYFKDEARPSLEARMAVWNPELQVQAEKAWSELFEDVRSALEEDPAGPRAQALVDRWHSLLNGFLGGETQLVHGVKALYADRANWPPIFQDKMAPFTDERVWDFFRRAAAARRSGSQKN
jgi:DNA-binding transcriptional MerR regulator